MDTVDLINIAVRLIAGVDWEDKATTSHGDDGTLDKISRQHGTVVESYYLMQSWAVFAGDVAELRSMWGIRRTGGDPSTQNSARDLIEAPKTSEERRRRLSSTMAVYVRGISLVRDLKRRRRRQSTRVLNELRSMRDRTREITQIKEEELNLTRSEKLEREARALSRRPKPTNSDWFGPVGDHMLCQRKLDEKRFSWGPCSARIFCSANELVRHVTDRFSEVSGTTAAKMLCLVVNFRAETETRAPYVEGHGDRSTRCSWISVVT